MMVHSYGFIGVGTISSCVIHGVFKARKCGKWSKECGVDPVILSPRGRVNVANLVEQFGADLVVAKSNQDVVDQCEVVFLGVLPAQVKDTLSDLSFRPSQTLISMVSTTPHAELVNLCKVIQKEQVVRTIPMPAVRRLEGTILVHPSHKTAQDFFSSVGKVVPVAEESQFTRLIALTCFQGDLYKRLAIMQEWLTKDGIPKETSVNFISALFNTVISDVKDPNSHEIFNELVAEQTPGGLNEGVIQWQKDMGTYDALDQSLDRVYAKIAGTSKE